VVIESRAFAGFLFSAEMKGILKYLFEEMKGSILISLTST
jgi:hypothetical protein